GLLQRGHLPVQPLDDVLEFIEAAGLARGLDLEPVAHRGHVLAAIAVRIPLLADHPAVAAVGALGPAVPFAALLHAEGTGHGHHAGERGHVPDLHADPAGAVVVGIVGAGLAHLHAHRTAAAAGDRGALQVADGLGEQRAQRVGLHRLHWLAVRVGTAGHGAHHRPQRPALGRGVTAGPGLLGLAAGFFHAPAHLRKLAEPAVAVHA